MSHQVAKIRELLHHIHAIARDHDAAQEAMRGHEYAVRCASMWGQGNARIRLMDAYAKQIGERLSEIEDVEDFIQTAATARVNGAIAMHVDAEFRSAIHDDLEVLNGSEA